MSQHQTIELRSYRPENSHDLSTTRMPLVSKKHDDSKISNVQLKIEKEFRKLNSITNLKKVMFFIYECLFFDVIFNFYHAYLLIEAFTDILAVGLSLIYIVEYGISLWNAVLYLKIIIEYKEYAKEVERKKEMENFRMDKRKVKIEYEESMLAVPIVLSKPLQGIRNVIFFRFFAWHIKYFLYIVVIAIRRDFYTLEYINIGVLLIDYFLYHILKFYYKVILRIEAYKELYKLEVTLTNN
jgi:hypothetical protein